MKRQAMLERVIEEDEEFDSYPELYEESRENPFFAGAGPWIIGGLGLGVLVLGSMVAYQLSRKK